MKNVSARIERLKFLVADFLGTSRAELHPLTGDASTRKYYRFYDDMHSWILMDNGKSINISSDPFILHSRYLKEMGLPVPFIRHTWEEDGVIVLEDLSDMTLKDLYDENPQRTIERIYPKVLEILTEMHQKCRKSSDIRIPAFTLRFNTEKYMQELQFFRTHFLINHLKIHINHQNSQILETGFRWLSDTLSAEPDVFTHRDFHSRNLMVRDNRIYMIDYQDARMGVMEYDLASLLRDAYVQLPESFISEFLLKYYEAMDIESWSDVAHRHYIFGLMCLQRNLKALGTFGFQAAVRHNKRYLQHVPVLYHHLKQEIKRLDSFQDTMGDQSIKYGSMIEVLNTLLPIS